MHSTGCYPLLAVRFCHGHRSAPDKRVLNRGLSQYNDVQFLVDSAFKQGKKPPSRSLRGTLWRFALRYPRLARALLQPPPNIFQLYWCYWLALDRSAPDPSMQRCPVDLVAPARFASASSGLSGRTFRVVHWIHWLLARTDFTLLRCRANVVVLLTP